MATHLLLPIPAAGIRASAVSGHRSSDNARRKTSVPTAGNNGGSWWTPLFGWSPNADYIESSPSSSSKIDPIESELRSSEKNYPATKAKFAPGCFTEEKAKQLRMKMAMDSGNFHDVMYHSAIASRLASDFSSK